jgi:hypothetical protein
MQDKGLRAGIPRIRRARGFRLYDLEGRRCLDLYRDGALLGHRAASVVTVMKSILSQGLSTALPTVWESRLVSAIGRMFPSRGAVRLYASPEHALDAVAHALGAPLAWEDVYDPAMAELPATPSRVAFWRPLLPAPPATGALLLQLPFTVCAAPAPVCCTADAPPSDPLPGFILAAAARGLAALTRATATPALSGNPVLERAIDRAPGWNRRGPYVHAVFPEAEYPRVHAVFLRAGVLLFPGYHGPSVLPGECSPGETRLLADLFARIPGG